MHQKAGTGIGKVDEILDGLRVGDNVIWHDDSGSLAYDYCLKLMEASAREEKPVIYVSFDRSPNNLVKKLGALADAPGLIILDCFTHGKGGGSELFLKYYSSREKNPHVTLVENPSDPQALSDALESCLADNGLDTRFIFESITGMQDLWGDEERILKFYTRTCPKLYELSTIAYWLIEHRAHSDRLKAGIAQIAQVVIELSVKRGKFFFNLIKAEGREHGPLNKPQGYWVRDGEVVFGSGDQKGWGRIDIGSRLKHFRTSAGLSQTGLAKQVGVTPSTISQIENGQIYPSLPALFRMAELLAVETGSFFSDNSAEEATPVYEPSQWQDVNIPGITGKGGSVRQVIPSGGETGFEVWLLEIEPGRVIKQHFFDEKCEEVGYVIEGSVLFQSGSRDLEAVKGSLIHLVERTPSRWKNKGEEKATILWLKLRQA